MATTSTPRELKNETKKKGGTLLILAGVAGILLLTGANVGFWLYHAKPRLPGPVLGPERSAAAASTEAGAALENVTLDPFIVNLGEGYLKVAMTLSVQKNGQPDLAHSALVRDTILDALSSQDADALLTVEGKAALKKTLRTALEATVPGMALDRIYFTEFLVQR